ncbi:hypothetical protein LSUE1_G001785 [Lachnellula suecica]|uniref:Uncharacterized protein n=1 Tax=Lachnellula suecica TaxID=602035 RepID=A0A8T9CEM3_9HELO|nr:hypothetical protein LSUE1_G001785 [Lachnellula suecica]
MFVFPFPGDSRPLSRVMSGFVFRFGIFRPSYYQLALSHDPATNLTYGLLIAKTADHEFPLMTQSLLQHRAHVTHPLLTAALLSKLVIASTASRIQASDRSLNELEESTGQHEYINIPMKSPLELDFMAATRRLNFVGRTLGVERMRAGSTILTLEFMAMEMYAIHDIAIFSHGGITSNGYEESSTLVRELINSHINACQNLALRAEYEEKRTQTQLAVVYQFMTQKEALTTSKIAYTSATIATEAKKDSSAMKAIAVLTMFFLPGTFLAAVFAMPTFDWNNASHPVVKESFKYYWAIAVPMTFLVLLCWGVSVWVPWKEWLPRVPERSKGKVVGFEEEGRDGMP